LNLTDASTANPGTESGRTEKVEHFFEGGKVGKTNGVEVEHEEAGGEFL
jgi:hypothetical protein